MNEVGDVKQGSQFPRADYDAMQDNAAKVDIFASVIEIGCQRTSLGVLDWVG